MGLFREICIKYSDLVYKCAMYYSGQNVQIAEEAVQEVFLMVYDELEHLNKDHLKAWLIVVTKNVVLNICRKRAREAASENLIEIADARQSNMKDWVWEELMRKEREVLGKRILDALNGYDERWYHAVVSAYCLGMPQKEIAEKMGISVKALHSMLARARQWIKKNFSEEYDETKYT